MRKVFLKSVAALMIACMFVLTFGGFTAREVAVEVAINEGFTEIIVDGVDCCEKEQQIIALLNGGELMSPMSILCIFGHSMAQTTAIEINHRFWATSPRCRETRYRVDYCTRSSCNHMVLTQIGTPARIPCCS
jgi:hypothetical protein